jgi:hypothetical protein
MGIPAHTIGAWKRLLFTTGSLDKKKPDRSSTKPRKYTPERIKELMDRSGTATPVSTDGSGSINTPKNIEKVTTSTDPKPKKSKKKKKKKFFDA